MPSRQHWLQLSKRLPNFSATRARLDCEQGVVVVACYSLIDFNSPYACGTMSLFVRAHVTVMQLKL